ncbi:MAG TPA: sugar ABC transporter substrate-binding protein [Spirochaetota bacterium]|nr:sugar ABC transporter substrate-binding protein [Spirochaetota bacterium]
MKRIKFIVVLTLAAVMAAGCSGQKETGKTKLTWVTDNNPARKRQIYLFEKKYPDIKIEPNYAIRKNPEVILTQLASGKPSFDLLDVHYPYLLRELASKGQLWDITGRLQKDGIDVNDFWPQCDVYYKVDGKVYGLPANGGSCVLWYNKKHFREASIDEITERITWDRVYKIAYKLTKKNSEGRIYRFGINYHLWLMNKLLMIQSGGELLDVDNKTIGFDNPTFARYCRMFNAMKFSEKQCAPTAANLESIAKAGNWGGGSLFAAGNASMVVNGRWMIAEWRKHKELEYSIAPMPYMKGKPPKNIFLSRGIVIPKDSPDREAAYKFIKYLYSEDYNRTILRYADGIPAVKSWVKNEEFLNPKWDDEKKNHIYLEEMKYSVPRKLYEGIDQKKFEDIVITQQFDRYLNQNLCTYEKMMATIKQEVKKYFY